VVARAIAAEMARTGARHVFLDLSHRGPEFVRRRFPRIYETCLKHGIDLGRQPAPVAPAAHYAMGGVRTDLNGRTSLPRLFAAGEAACTGVHGANRLASNSLLEGVVFGARAGRAMRECAGPAPPAGVSKPALAGPSGLPQLEIQRIAWEQCGIVRHGEGLRAAGARLERSEAPPSPLGPHYAEARNMQQVAWLIARCALARQESRGAHFRADFPAKSAAFAKHSVVKGDEISFR
jgi:L-aspartate oxidase